MRNPIESVEKFIELVNKFFSGHQKRVILEFGCGNANIALSIARQNPDCIVIATDLFDDSFKSGKYYNDYTKPFQEGNLNAQKKGVDNLLVLRSSLDILTILPDEFISDILFVKPDITNEGQNESIIRNLLLGFRNSKNMINKLRDNGHIVIQPRYPLKEYGLYTLNDNGETFMDVNINELSDWSNEKSGQELHKIFSWKKNTIENNDSLDRALFPPHFFTRSQ